jgi:diguanylate cyclase
MTSHKKSNVVHLPIAPEPDGKKRVGRPTGKLGKTAPSADYYERIESYAQKIRQTKDVRDIINMLEEALSETRALHTVNELAVAHQQVALAEMRIERLKSELELVSQLVREDQLTGAMNRRGLDDALEREAARADRCKTPLCIALIDLDDFKGINDLLGHQVGDLVLVHLVAIVKETIRSNDMIGRYGGDEFMVLMPGAQIDEACEVMDRLHRRLTLKPPSVDKHELTVTFSAGVAMRVLGEDCQAVIQRADQALYDAKNLGKDRVNAA